MTFISRAEMSANMRNVFLKETLSKKLITLTQESYESRMLSDEKMHLIEDDLPPIQHHSGYFAVQEDEKRRRRELRRKRAAASAASALSRYSPSSARVRSAMLFHKQQNELQMEYDLNSPVLAGIVSIRRSKPDVTRTRVIEQRKEEERAAHEAEPEVNETEQEKEERLRKDKMRKAMMGRGRCDACRSTMMTWMMQNSEMGLVANPAVDKIRYSSHVVQRGRSALQDRAQPKRKGYLEREQTNLSQILDKCPPFIERVCTELPKSHSSNVYPLTKSKTFHL